jgi:2-oxoisovalerate dehydrogenase E1 component alpha subunit
MLNLLSRADDPNSGGRQMPMHWSSVRYCVPSQSSPTGTQIPQAAGAALASRIKRDGAVTYCYFGDGTTSQGDFHEGLNFAAVHRLPAIFICEANGIAISERMDKQMAVKSVAARAAAYGIPGVSVNGGDVLDVYRATKEAADRARAGEGPTLIEAKVHRLTPHSSDDDGAYRKPEEVAQERKHDGIERFRRYLQEHQLLSAKQERRMRERITAMIDDATDFAISAPIPDASTFADHVYA